MANPFSKGWKYMMSAFDQKIDENADPQVQINQAIEQSKKQHADIQKQAAAVIGNKSQLEMKMNRMVQQVNKLQDQTRQALTLADNAAAQGDQAKASEYGGTAEVLASQLVSLEQELEQTRSLHQQAEVAAQQAQAQAKESEIRLKEQLGQLNQLRSQAAQADMQAKATEAMDTMGQFTADRDVPTLDQVRDKIEQRYANALGSQALMEDSLAGRMAEITTAGTDVRANARLAEIRAQMAGGAAGSELTTGAEKQEPQAIDAAPEAEASNDAAPKADAAAPQSDTEEVDGELVEETETTADKFDGTKGDAAEGNPWEEPKA